MNILLYLPGILLVLVKQLGFVQPYPANLGCYRRPSQIPTRVVRTSQCPRRGPSAVTCLVVDMTAKGQSDTQDRLSSLTQMGTPMF